DDLALLADPLRERDGEPPGAAAEIEHGHAGPDIRALDDDVRPVGARERAVELDEPAQPCVARDLAGPREHAPHEADEQDQADEADEDVDEGHRASCGRVCRKYPN